MRLMFISGMEDTMSTKEKILDAALTLFAENGYVPVKGCCVDMFPNTQHVETVVLLGWKDVD